MMRIEGNEGGRKGLYSRNGRWLWVPKNGYSYSMLFRVNSIVGQNAPATHDSSVNVFRAIVCRIPTSSRESDIPQCSSGPETLWWVLMSFSNL
jgi:hypothetical protein